MTQDEINTRGGTAFPVSIPGVGDNGWQGMSLKDWFAGQALAGLAHLCAHDTLVGETYAQHISRLAYETAEAMLAARASDIAEFNSTPKNENP